MSIYASNLEENFLMDHEREIRESMAESIKAQAWLESREPMSALYHQIMLTVQQPVENELLDAMEIPTMVDGRDW